MEALLLKRVRHGPPMTVGIAIKCSDGLVVASDSKATFGRGVPVSKSVSKIHEIKHDGLEFPVVVMGAGMTAFVDKFLDRIRRDAISKANEKLAGKKLDIIDFTDRVCEPMASALFKEYCIDRMDLTGGHYSMGLIVAGATRDGELRAFFVHQDGLTESIPDYGTVGSGAAYAELFLRDVVSTHKQTTAQEAANLALHAVKGAEIMDPNVGGRAKVVILSCVDAKAGDKTKKTLKIEHFNGSDYTDKRAAKKMASILREMRHQMGAVQQSTGRKSKKKRKAKP